MERIINRMTPCCCGCKGRDSHHQATYTRAVRGVRPTTGRAKVRILETPSAETITAEGVATFPWGASRVVMVAGRWMVDRDAQVAAMNAPARIPVACGECANCQELLLDPAQARRGLKCSRTGR